VHPLYSWNMANIRYVMKKPPKMLMQARKVAIAPQTEAIEGLVTLVRESIPPTAMIPEIALVTLIRGVWREGVTDQTTWKPTITARTNFMN